MSNGQPQPGQDRIKPAEAMSAAYFVCNVWASAISPFTRRGFGTEAMAWNGLFALFLLLCNAAYCGTPGPWIYLGLWLLLLIYHRIQTFRAVRRGVIRHSRDPGYPWLAMKVPFVRSEATATGIIEPLMCLVVGTLLCEVSVDVGGFVMVGGLAFFLRNALEREVDRVRLERMQDAQIEQTYYAEKFRNRRGG